MKPIPVTIIIPTERVQDLLCNALEGGSNYWYEIMSFNYPNGQDKKSLNIEFQHIELPFFEGGSLTIRDNEEAHKGDLILDLKAIEEGLQIMVAKEIRHFADFISENDDAITGDVFLQCCLFKEVIYG